MEIAVTFIVGFGAALLGAVAGFLGAVYVERWRIRRMRTGIVRALLGELRRNSLTGLVALRRGTMPVPEFSSETWQAANFELAQFVSEELYKDILFIYDVLPLVKELCGDREAKPDLEWWLKRVKEVMSNLQELPEAAKFRMLVVDSAAELEEAAKKARSEEGEPADRAEAGE